jgi:hypothetical protein
VRDGSRRHQDEDDAELEQIAPSHVPIIEP